MISSQYDPYHEQQVIPNPLMNHDSPQIPQKISFPQYNSPQIPQFQSIQYGYNQSQQYQVQFNNNETDEQRAFRMHNEEINRNNQEEQKRILQQQTKEKEQQKQQNLNKNPTYQNSSFNGEVIDYADITVEGIMLENNQIQNVPILPQAYPFPPPPPPQYQQDMQGEQFAYNNNPMIQPQMKLPCPLNNNQNQFAKLSTLKRKSTQLRSSRTYRKSDTASNKIQNYSDKQVYLYSERPSYHQQTWFWGLLFVDDCCCTSIINLIFQIVTLPLRIIIKGISKCFNCCFNKKENCDEKAMKCLYCPFKCCGDWINQCWFSCDNFCCNGLSFFPSEVSDALSSNCCLKCCLQLGQYFKNCCSFGTSLCDSKSENCCCEYCCHEIGSCLQYCCSPQGFVEECCKNMTSTLNSCACCCDNCSCENLCSCFVSTKDLAGGVVSECCCCIIKSTGQILEGVLKSIL